MEHPDSCCHEFDYHLGGKEVCITYNRKFREISIDVKGTNSYQIINFCPWCGHKFPTSLRDKWFEETKDLKTIPSEFNTAEWWLNRNIELSFKPSSIINV